MRFVPSRDSNSHKKREGGRKNLHLNSTTAEHVQRVCHLPRFPTSVLAVLPLPVLRDQGWEPFAPVLSSCRGIAGADGALGKLHTARFLHALPQPGIACEVEQRHTRFLLQTGVLIAVAYFDTKLKICYKYNYSELCCSSFRHVGVGVLRPALSPPNFFQRRPRLCLDMVSTGSSTLLGPLPEHRLYLSSDAPQIITVLSSLALARDLASGLHVTALTSLKAFKSVSMHKKNCFEKACF